MKKILCVVPANNRKNQRVPGKNCHIDICGKTCLDYTLEHLAECSHPMMVVVVSNDEIAGQIAEKHKVTWLKAPEVLAVTDKLLDVVDFAIRRMPEEYDAVILAYANVPVRFPGLFDRLIAEFDGANLDAVGFRTTDYRSMGGSIHTIEYLEMLKVNPSCKRSAKILEFGREEIVEIDTYEDVQWARNLLTAKAYQQFPKLRQYQ